MRTRFLEGNSFVLCREFCSAVNSFDSSPPLGKICLLVHVLNKISPFFPFMLTDAFLDVFLQSWQFSRGMVSFVEVVSSGHHIQYLYWYKFLVFPISASMVSSSRWGLYSDSVDHGCLERVTDIWMKISNPPPWS